VPSTSYSALNGIEPESITLHVLASAIDAYKAAESWKDFKIVVTEIKGDANDDGIVNVADIVEVVNKSQGHPSNRFNMKAADMDGDGKADAKDIEKIVNIIMDK